MASSLSEADSKALLRDVGIPFCREVVVATREDVMSSAHTIGYPLVLKANTPDVAHKSERGLVFVGIRSDDELAESFDELIRRLNGEPASFIVAEMVQGDRELIVGMLRDPACGAFVLIGHGGVAAEAIHDIVLLPVPTTSDRLRRTFDRLRARKLFGEFRGQQPIDMSALERVVAGLTVVADSRRDVESIDINPLIVKRDGQLVAVDALVVTSEPPTTDVANHQKDPRRLNAMFEPRGVVVIGASTHPGKFGFVSLHNIAVNGFGGHLYGLNQSGEPVLDTQMITTLDDIPQGEVDLAFFCTPASANEELLRQCASRGIRAAFVASAGYRETDAAGADMEHRLVDLADELGVVLGGPNGQGLVSTPASLCAQIVAPYPPAGTLSIASQSGNFVSSFLNLALHSGVGIARAVSAGNSAQTSIADYLDYFLADSQTRTSLAYVENVDDGRKLLDSVERHCRVKPLVLIKGGRTELGKRAASSHTGAMATDYESFAARCESLGASVVDDPETAFDVAAAFDTLPLPRGRRLAILTTVGGWGVVTSDALNSLEYLMLSELSDHLISNLDAMLPSRWSRSNPIDCAGGETRDTVPDALRLLCVSGEVDLVLLLGLGIQGNQARMMESGGVAERAGLGRIISYHERQEERYVDAAADLSVEFGIPVAMATELAIADRENAALKRSRERSAYVFSSGPRAVRALNHLVRYALHLEEMS